jgi:hypothetical protein
LRAPALACRRAARQGSIMSVEDRLVAALRQGGMLDVPDGFSVALVHQEIDDGVLAEIDTFIEVFDRVTTRSAWQEAVTASAPAIARSKRKEVCFFSAWDFHLPPEQPHQWQLIECNDNGSGLFFAALLNRAFYEVSGLGARPAIEAPATVAAFEDHVMSILRTEADAFFGGPPPGLALIIDDARSIQEGKFRHEFLLLRDLCRRGGWHAEVASPEETTWDGGQLLCRTERVSFVINRSTDFFLEADVFSPLRAAYETGGIFVAPNPFTYATRSDKRLMELLSRPVCDDVLGITPDERRLLTAHVPETQLLRAENVLELAREKDGWFFKPCHGFASHGILTGPQVGRTRLRHLLKKGAAYVAQRRAPKSRLASIDGAPLWVDLRVWACRGKRLLVSGRASRQPDGVDLSPPGGWIPTYAQSPKG